jgi:hypothetical protein
MTGAGSFMTALVGNYSDHLTNLRRGGVGSSGLETFIGEVTTWIGWIPGSPERLVSGLG